MWNLSRSRVLLDEPPEEEDVLRGAPPASAAAPASVRARVGAQVRAAGCSGGRAQVHGVACRVRTWQGPDASRGCEVTAPEDPSDEWPGPTGRGPQSQHVWGTAGTRTPGTFRTGRRRCPSLCCHKGFGVRLETPGTRGDRFQARYFYSGVGETEKS